MAEVRMATSQSSPRVDSGVACPRKTPNDDFDDQSATLSFSRLIPRSVLTAHAQEIVDTSDFLEGAVGVFMCKTAPVETPVF